MMNGWDGGMTTTGWIFMGLFWVLLILVIVWAITQVLPARSGSPEPKPPVKDDSPETILAQRLARGEIDAETYDALREKLHDDAVPAGRAAP